MLASIMSIDHQTTGPVRLNHFLQRHAVFTVDELDRFLSDRGSRNTSTRSSLLAYHRKQGRILHVRRGLYATVPWGMDPASMTVDPSTQPTPHRQPRRHLQRYWRPPQLSIVPQLGRSGRNPNPRKLKDASAIIAHPIGPEGLAHPTPACSSRRWRRKAIN